MIPKEINADDIPAVEGVGGKLMKARTGAFPKWEDIRDAYKLKHDVEGRCGNLPTLEEREIWLAMMLKRERLVMLTKMGNVLNSRIAKMEILDSKKPSPFRKGIIEGYKDIEEWARQEEKKL